MGSNGVSSRTRSSIRQRDETGDSDAGQYQSMPPCRVRANRAFARVSAAARCVLHCGAPPHRTNDDLHITTQLGHQLKKLGFADAAELATSRAVLLDVREAQEWQHGHIQGAVPAPRGLVEFYADY